MCLRVSRNCSTRHDEVNRLLPAQPRMTRATAAFLFERRAHRRRRPARPLGVPRDLAARPPRRVDRRAARAARPRRARARSPTASRATSRWLSRNAFQSMPACARVDRSDRSAGARTPRARRSISRSTSEAGTLERHARRQLLHQLGAHLALGRVPRLVLEVLAHARAQRVERLELAEVLRELVVELRQHAALDALHRHGIRRRRCPASSADRVVGRVVNREASWSRPASRPSSCSSKPGGFALAPSSTLTSLCVSALAAGVAPLEIERDACRRRSTPRPSTGSNRAARSRSRCSACRPPRRRRALDGAPQRDRRVVARARTPARVSNDAVNVSGWPSSTVTSRTSGVSTGFDAALAQRLVDRARNQIVRDVVEDLLLEALLDDARRRLARAEARDARLARVVARDAIDLGVDDVARDFDAQVLARLVDVDEFGFHRELQASG